MSVIFERIRAKTTTKSEPQVLHIVWHKEFPLLAVSTSNGVVTIYDEEGDQIHEANLSRSTNCTASVWHPTLRVLCTGWKDGAIVIYDDHKKEVKELKGLIHEKPINKMKWSPDGSRLIVCEKEGGISIYKLNAFNKLDLIRNFSGNYTIRHIVFKKHTIITKKDDEDVYEECWIFFFATKEGAVFTSSEEIDRVVKAFNLHSPLIKLLFYEEKQAILALTQTSLLVMYKIEHDLKMRQIMKVKVSLSAGGNPNITAHWIGRGLLATSANEKMIRVWNLENDENFFITSSNVQDPLINFNFNGRKRVIAAVSATGTLHFWQYVGSSDCKGAEDWEEYAEYKLEEEEEVSFLKWGPGEELLGVIVKQQVNILRETILKRKLKDNVIAIQTSMENITLNYLLKKDKFISLKCPIKIKGLDVTGTHVVMWNGKKIMLYEHKDGMFRLEKEMEMNCSCVTLHARGVFVTNANRIEVFNFQGIRKQTLSFLEEEGHPILMDIEGDFLTAITKNNYIKLWNIGGREGKQIGVARKILEDFYEIVSIKLNCNGTKVSILSKIIQKNGIRIPSTKIYIYDLDKNKLYDFDFGTMSRYPISHHWDGLEPKLLGVEAKSFVGSDVKDELKFQSRFEICTLFATHEHGVLLQDNHPLDKKYSALVGLLVPNFYFQIKNPTPSSEIYIEDKRMRDFEGIQVIDDVTRNALLNFSYYLTIGNLDEAYKAVKQIKDPTVWHNMAQMCVKTKKMDVAEICLGNMQNARASRALREAKKEPEEDARIAMLAIQLGMIDEAEKLYLQCNRFDLLNKLYQAIGAWDKALECAEKYDRIHLRTTHYLYAKYLESIGDTNTAKIHYEKSRTHRFEIPRMLYEKNQIEDLAKYISLSADAELLCWWGQFLEGNEDYENALTFYEKAKDYLSLVRLYCFMGDFESATKIVNEVDDRAAAFHLARAFEGREDFPNAMKYYTIAESYRNAIRIAKQLNMDQEVLNLALKASPEIMHEAAEYFESINMKDKAVLLYQKGGHISHAINLCFREELYDDLMNIAESLDKKSDPEVLMKVGHFFADHKKYEKAVQMFINAQEYDLALDMIVKHNVILTEEIANQFPQPRKGLKDKSKEEIEKQKKNLLQLANIAELQENYDLATKKYVQAGLKVDAMKCLIKSGNTEKIIFFAKVSRQRELFILAANYLQKLNWHNDPDIMNEIIQFYHKGKAFESLSNFYVACSQVEIDEYREYPKALAAMKEALKYLMRTNVPDKEQKISDLKKRIYLVDKFVKARALIKRDPNEMIKVCNEIINEATEEDAVRVGDVFAVLIEFYYDKERFREAYDLIKKMEQRGITLNYYLEERMVYEIKTAMGENVQQDVSNEMDEEIVEEIPQDEISSSPYH